MLQALNIAPVQAPALAPIPAQDPVPVPVPVPQDIDQIERDCDFEDIDMDEVPAHYPKVSEIHENEMSKIN